MKLKMIGGAPPTSSGHNVRYWSIAAIIMPSQTGPQPMDASPMLAMTMPGWRLMRLKSAAPVEMSPEPPTMALFGMTPKGGKKACIEPPNPLLKPVILPKISASAP